MMKELLAYWRLESESSEISKYIKASIILLTIFLLGFILVVITLEFGVAGGGGGGTDVVVNSETLDCFLSRGWPHLAHRHWHGEHNVGWTKLYEPS